MTSDRRRALAEWAARRDGVIVEDDNDAELRYSGHPVASLQSLTPARTFQRGIGVQDAESWNAAGLDRRTR